MSGVQVLGPDGKPAAQAAPPRRVRAKYDAAQTTPENRKHWAGADYLSADAAASPEVRERLRSRSRYEAANNSYARGIVDTLASYVVGTGPRLQMLLDDDQANREVERQFTRWALETGLAEKLRVMRVAQAESGEAFGLITTNRRVSLPVQLDLRVIEADQVTTPSPAAVLSPRAVDGIEFDGDGNPVNYHVLRRHPGDATFLTAVGAYDTVPARLVLHLYRAIRPQQSRGVPDLTPALPLFAMLRRYTLAVIQAAEQAAVTGGVIYTDAPADGEAAQVDPLDQIEIERGEWWTMPAGWKPGQIKAEQPTTVYGEFHAKIINEIARALNIPFNVAAGNSSSYNYASGRLDHQAFYRSIRIDQQRLTQVVLDPLFRAWLQEAQLVEGFLPQAARSIDATSITAHQWFFDGLEHVDPQKEAAAQAQRLASNTTTLAAEYARQGLDWEESLRQRARERQLMDELGLTPEPAAAPATDDEDDDDA
ncbi:MAG: phage portal protein [Alphaproteobacteria bacterium]|jgi:lambda family phage portal protein|nr:phage portal protein [Alphaproteobacteria bacterium]